MKIVRKLSLSLLCFLGATIANAQDKAGSEENAAMKSLHSNGKIYVVVTCVAFIFTALAIFIWSLDRKVKRLEKYITKN